MFEVDLFINMPSHDGNANACYIVLFLAGYLWMYKPANEQPWYAICAAWRMSI
jgi:hypothetical protein